MKYQNAASIVLQRQCGSPAFVASLTAVLVAVLVPAARGQTGPYTLTIAASHGSVTVSPAKASYDAGEQVQLMPRPETGYCFTGWSGDAHGQNLVLNLTMDSNKSITATFSPWTAPIGIPTPAFGISETHSMYVGKTYDFGSGPEPYRDAGNGPYTHYVDNTHPSATDTANPYGTAGKPRVTIPQGLAPGSVVEVHGGPYTYNTGGKIYINGIGSAAAPIFVRGDSNRPQLNYEVIVVGQYLILENVTIYNMGLSIRVPTGYSYSGAIHHIGIRNCELYGNETTTGVATILMAGSGVDKNNIVIYNNHIHHSGDYDYPLENDKHGINILNDTHYVWVVDNHIHHNGGDSFQSGHGVAYTASHLFIGRNIMHDDGENAVDLKEVTDIIVSQNAMYNYPIRDPSSDGTITATHYGPTLGTKRAWFLFNEMYNADTAANQVSSGPEDVYYIGNVIHDIQGWVFRGWSHRNVYHIGNTMYRVGNGIDDESAPDVQAVIVDNIFGQLNSAGGQHIVLNYTDYRNNAVVSNNLFEGGAHTNTPSPNSIEADPRFVAPTQNNFHLQAISPAIDAGISSGVVQEVFDRFEQLYGVNIRKDIEGEPRAGTWDIGAYEYASSGSNVAQGKTTISSTSYGGLMASNATDGNLNSRWSSQFGDNEWIYVDLGAAYTINRVVLRWEGSYGRGYKLQVSSDTLTWSDVYNTTAGDGGVDDVRLSAPASGRYVRMLGTQRATMYGYSLWEFEVYGGTGAPEITVTGNGVSIADGDTTPSATDGTDFGSAAQGGTAISRTFMVRNDGTATLVLGPATVPAGFTLTEPLSSTLASGAWDTFTVRLETTTGGTKAGDISFSTNDSDENPFRFRITGVVTQTSTMPPAEQFAGGSDSFDLANKAILFAPAGSSYTFTTRTITNLPTSPSGGTELSLGDDDATSVSLDAGKTVVLYGQSYGRFYVSSNGYLTFTQSDADFSETLADHFDTPRVSVLFHDLNPAAGGVVCWQQAADRVVVTWDAVASYGSTGVNTLQVEMYFDGRIQLAYLAVASAEGLVGLSNGAGVPAGFAETDLSAGGTTAPEIAVLSNGVTIADGNTVPSASDGTDFGTLAQGGTAVSRTFTVRNSGTATLMLGAVRVPTGFTLTEPLSSILAPGASDTFTVRLDTAAVGTKAGDISFATNDSDRNPFNFRITGTITAAATNLALGKTAVASTDYSGYPASNVTDGNLSSRWSSQFSDSQWIRVDLGSVYTVSRVVLHWEMAYGRGYKIQVSTDASTWSDVSSTTSGDGGVDDIVLSTPVSGRYVRMLGTQRATPYGYSLYELEVYGGAVAPEITVLGSGVSITDGDATPSATDGTDFGSAAQGGTAISRTYTVRNDGTAALTLGAVTVPAGFTLTEGLSSSLAPGATDTFTVRLDTATAGTKAGDISFATNDSNENPFNFRITGVVTAAATNLALGKTTVASTSYTGFPAGNVTDGSLSSRWSSLFSDDQWIYVDLGAVYTIDHIVLRWETAYGRSYRLQVSNDASTWSDVYSTTTGDGGVDDITLSAPVSGRYVRMLGIQRATPYGYSLCEFEVYG